MSYKPHFERFLESDPERLHFAAHSHHPWPDVSFEAHERAWIDASIHQDDKWDHIFGEVIPETQALVATILGLSDPVTLTFAPNTHQFLVRIFSCLDPPVRILTTDAEFHSFDRQSRRWEEAGLAIADRVPAEPFDTFAERFTAEARAGVHDLIYLSQVFFDSGFVVPELEKVVSSVPDNKAFFVVDGYHGFMAMPTNLGAIQDRVFYLAGGYKYAMSGEGACFLHAPAGYGRRPVDTGWYAGFGALTKRPDEVGYAADGSRFAGATYDPSGIYRMRAVLSFLDGIGVGVGTIRSHVEDLQRRLLANVPDIGELLPPPGHTRGNFVTWRNQNAEGIYRRLHDRKVVIDFRGDRLRIGFGIYHDTEDIDRLGGILEEIF